MPKRALASAIRLAPARKKSTPPEAIILSLGTQVVRLVLWMICVVIKFVLLFVETRGASGSRDTTSIRMVSFANDSKKTDYFAPNEIAHYAKFLQLSSGSSSVRLPA